MAYAQLAGVEPQAAFYAAPAALLLYALLAAPDSRIRQDLRTG